MQEELVLTVERVSKAFGGVRALQDFSCRIEPRTIVGLIGPNGAGKTTLFNVITGFIAPDAGSVSLDGRELTRHAPFRIARMGISRTFQDLRLLRQMTVLDNLLLAGTGGLGEGLWSPFFSPRWLADRRRRNEPRAMDLLEFVGLADQANHLGSELSYGQQKLVALACCLATDPDLLMLDEPVSGIHPALVEKILEMMQGFPKQGKTVVFIEHNLEAVMEVADKVIVMDEGKKLTEGAPSIIRDDPRVIEAYLE